MTTVLKSGEPLEDLLKKLETASVSKKKGIDASKYSGILKSNMAPIEFQKKRK